MPLKVPERQSLYTPDGQRKYINAEERVRFLNIAHQTEQHDPKVRTLCEVLAHTGCRISEALELTTSSIFLSEKVIVIRSLKKRRAIVFRHVPVPDELIALLDQTHQIHQANTSCKPHRLWAWHRVTAYLKIKDVMARSKITGLQSCPKGLRHGFGIHAAHCGIPVNLIQRWLGHADIATTAIYLNAVGKEERIIAERMWTTPGFINA